MVYSKKEIRRLGNSIRQQGKKLDDKTLNKLQDYRVSHKEALSVVFNELCNLSKSVRRKSIVTCRIKRFESIINKLDRFDTMQFDRMWDIAGCRCILKTEEDVYKLKSKIKNSFTLKNDGKDYIINPKKDGYKSLHLYITPPNFNVVIEVQIRTQKDHNWATLVEISDLLFDSKLKELGNDKKLSRFHLLLSKTDRLTLEEKKEILHIVREYKYATTLSKRFSTNYIEVRKQWVQFEKSSSQKYFLIETSKDQIPIIKGYESYDMAEQKYFDSFKVNNNANIVLTHLPKPIYKQITIAYSNYLLTVHSFTEDYFQILISLACEALKTNNLILYYKTLDQYFKVNNQLLIDINDEIIHLNNINIKTSAKNRYKLESGTNWNNDIKSKLLLRQKTNKSLVEKVNHNFPRRNITFTLFKYVTQYIIVKYNKELMRKTGYYQSV